MRGVELCCVLASAWPAACTSDNLTSDAGLGPDGGVVVAEVGVRDARALPDVVITRHDGGLIVHHDAGAPRACTTTCQCPQGLACLGGVCGTAGVGPVWCCDNPGCPQSQPCLDRAERPGQCPTPPDAGPDAGPRDIGAGAIGSTCEDNTDCDQTLGYSCWTHQEIRFLWGGYCTLEGCAGGCPQNAACITLNLAEGMQRTGCMQTCVQDQDCRTDAFCFAIPNAPIRICLPDCRDDLLDCSPRNGSTYCSDVTGQCEQTPMQSAGVAVGDPCTDSTMCGPGQVCMGDDAWGFSGGMCTRVCDVLPESTPCAPQETCQPLAGVGMCFRNCAAGACPNRAGATCGRMDPNWTTESCYP